METYGPFQIFGLTPCFDLDLDILEKSYENLQAALHPDQFQGVLEKKAAEKAFTRMQTAYQLLKNPLARAQWLMTFREFWPLPQDSEILEEMMAYREEAEQNGPHQCQARYHEAFTAFAHAWSGEKHKAQKAYLRLSYLYQLAKDGKHHAPSN